MYAQPMARYSCLCFILKGSFDMANYPYTPYTPNPPVYGGYMPQPYPIYPQQPPAPQPPMPQPQPAPQPAAQQTPQPMQGNANGGIVCAPVTSREEAVATRVEAFGPGFIMPDFGHGMIYFKRFNDKTALADFEEYQRVPQAGEQAQQPHEPPAPMLDIPALVGAIQSRFDTVERKVDALAERLDKPAPKTSTVSKGGSRK